MDFRRNNPYQDRDIIAGIQAGGLSRDRALNLLYRSHWGYIHQGMSKFNITLEEAISAYDDAILGLMIQVNKKQFQERAKLSSYLYQIFRNKCIDQHKKNQKRLEIAWEEAFPNLTDKSVHFLQEIIGKESWDIASNLIKQLGEKCRQILMLAAEGYRPAEIAQQLGLKNAQTAKSRKYKCVKRFRQLIEKQNPELTRMDDE